MRASSSFGLGLLSLVVALAGCGGPTPDTDAGTADAFVPADVNVVPDGARHCTTDDECADGVECTREHCDTTYGFCVVTYDLAMCDDGVFCNGVEQCDSRDGCIPGARITCNDDQVCTIDRCDETSRTCQHEPRDLDEDGDVDFFCDGGNDCDDRDATRSSLQPEICDDGIDNDCDGLDDDPMDVGMCGRPPHDVCADPLDVSAGGTFVINTAGAAADYAIGCVGTARQDIVLQLTLDAPHNVEIRAEGDFFTTALALRTTCESAASETECRTGYPAEIRRRALDAGTYYLIVTGYGAGEIAVTVDLADPTPPPPNETCDAPIDVSAGGTFAGSMLDVTDDFVASCPRGFTDQPDLVYTFTTTEERDVRITATSPTGEPMSWEVRPTCGSSSGVLRCVYGGPAVGRVHQLPAGTYYLVVEGPSYVEVDFQLTVEFLDPTPQAAGDLCTNAIPLTLATRTAGSLVGLEDDLDTSCGFYYPEAVYSFTLADRSDVLVEIDGGGTYLDASVRPTCTDSATQLRCTGGAPIRQRLRDLPAGTYYVLVEASRASSFFITVTASTPTPTIAVVGNDTCDTAYVIPATGGYFTGNTSAMTNDYTTATCGSMAQSRDVAFRLDLPTRRRVIASTEGSSFDTVLHVQSPTCRSGFDVYCNDDSGGAWSLLDLTLDPGTYFFVVDGFGTAAVGDYALEVQITDPM